MKLLTILIADDQPINRKLLRAQLEAEGHTVLEAVDGVEAFDRLEEGVNAIDLIISDILMPGMDGYRFCGEVRRSERHRHLPFIFCTATYTSPADEQLCLQIGGDKYLRKPVAAATLLSAIEEVLAGSRRTPNVTMENEDIIRQYTERLVFKLEQKNAELSAAYAQVALQVKALDTAAEAIFITDAEGLVSWVNRAYIDLTGCSPEVAGMSAANLKIGIEKTVFNPSFWRSRPETAWRGEAIIHRPDGSVRAVEQSVSPVRASDEGITHFVGIIHDITDRKKAEKSLRGALLQLRGFLDHSPAVLYALAIEGETVIPRFASENIERLLGFQPEETLTFEWWQGQLHPDDLLRAQASIAETLLRGASRTEYRIRHKDGTYRWVEDNRRLTRDADGRPSEMVGAWLDITERHKAQDALRESERRFQEMLNNLQLVSMMLDDQARIIYCNDYFLKLTGWQREEILGRDWFQLFIASEKVGEMRETYRELLAGLPLAAHHTNEILTRSGDRRILQWNNSLLRSPDGRVVGTASIAEDITDRRSLERQIVRAQRLESLGTLAGGIAHDMNNLLMPILMGVTVLRRLPPGDATRKAIDNIERSAMRGSDLVKQVLLFARGAETSRTTVEPETVIREVEAIAASTFPKDITMEISIAPDLNQVIGDATQLTQVLLNLCVNARDAMPSGGHLLVSARNAELLQQQAILSGGKTGGSYVVLEVADTGEGMTADVVDRIFDPFFTTKEVGKGTGLGLSTAQGIVISHGGFVSVASAPGAGSTFSVNLPAKTRVGAASAREADLERLPRGSGERILIVDDDAGVVAVTRQTLETFGYEVLVAEDGAQAIALFAARQKEIALVLTDMIMPVIDGPALVAALLRIDPRVKIVGTTGDPSGSRVAKIARLGITHVLTKPYTADVLLVTIARVLEERESDAS